MKLSLASIPGRLRAAAAGLKMGPELFAYSTFDRYLQGPEDDIIIAKGVDAYTDMARSDAEIYADITQALFLALPDISIVPGGDDPEDKRNSDLITTIISDMTGADIDPFVEMLRHAMLTGMGIAEPMLEYRDIPGVGRIVGLEGLYTRPTKSFTDAIKGVETDDYGRIMMFRQSAEYGGNEVEPGQVVYYAYQGSPENRYGTSILRPCHEPWAAKIKVRRVYQLFMVSNAAGIRHMKMDPKAFEDPNKRAKAQAAMEKLGSLSSFTTSSDWEMNIQIPSSGAGAHFKLMLDYLNGEIRRAILGDSAFSAQEGSQGSMASRTVSQENVRTSFAVVGRSFCNSVGEQLFPMLLKLNGYTTGKVPQLKPVAITTSEQARAEALYSLGELKKSGVLKRDLPEAAELAIMQSTLAPLDIQLDDIDRDGETDEETTALPSAGSEVQSTALNGAQVSSLLQIAIDSVAKRLPLETAIGIAKASFPAVPEQVIQDIFRPIKGFAPAPVAAADLRAVEGKRLNRAKSDAKKLSGLVDKHSKDLAAAWDTVYPQVLDHLTKQLFETKPGGGWKTTNLTAIRQAVLDSVQYKSSEIRNALTAGFTAADEAGKESAQAVLPVQAKQVGWTSASAKAALRNRVMFLLEDKYSSLATQLYYQIENGLIGNLSLAEVEAGIRTTLGNSAYADQYARTIMDTAMASAWNHARELQFASLEDVNGTGRTDIIGYEFIAVQDDFTTEQCSELHGMVFSVDDPSLPHPPLHYNCRSQLLPVFGNERDQYEFVDHDKSKDIISRMQADGQIQKGFGGL